MTVQDKYNRIIDLLNSSSVNNQIIHACISATSSELTFSFFDENNKVSKENILDTYTIREGIEQTLRPESPFVVGYEKLLPNLKSTELEYINICDITTEKGSFIIFTDYDYKVFLGILHSKRTLSEVRERMKGSKHYSENIFVNNKLKI